MEFTSKIIYYTFFNPVSWVLFIIGFLVLFLWGWYRWYQRRKVLIATYGETQGKMLANRKVWLGMSPEQVIHSWGSPRIHVKNRRNKVNGEVLDETTLVFMRRGQRPYKFYFRDYKLTEHHEVD